MESRAKYTGGKNKKVQYAERWLLKAFNSSASFEVVFLNNFYK